MVALIFVLQFKPVQNYISKKTADYLSKELHTTVSIESVYFRPFSSLRLKKVYIEDLDHDTLLYVDELSTRVDLRSIRDAKVIMNKMKLSNGKLFLKKYKDSSSNMTFLINYFKASKPRKKKKKGMDFILPNLELNQVDLRYKNFLVNNRNDKGINYNDIYIRGLTGQLKDIDYRNYLFKADIDNLSFKEKSGLVVKKLSTSAVIDSNKMEFSNLNLETNSSHIKNYVRFEYGQLTDLSDFIHKVEVVAMFKGSRITSSDIAFFAPQIDVTNFDVLIEGKVSGTVNHITAKDVQIRTGKDTWLIGDIRINGLPHIEQTLFDMDLDHLISTRRDLEILVAQLSGKKIFKLPLIFDRFGKIEYVGRITGFYNDFITQGIFKTGLGDVLADVDLEIKEQGRYSGQVFTDQFNLGQLLQHPDLGDVSFRAKLEGEGFDVDQLNEELEAQIAFIDYKGYRYHNLTVDGNYSHKQFAGDFSIDDKNIILDFSGKASLNSTLSHYDFDAQVKLINLYNLGLYRDTLSLSGNIHSNFDGNNLNTIDGELSIQDLVIATGGESTTVDSLQLFAEGNEANRSVAIRSTIADAEINGEFDLKALPAYIKSLTKRYVPSLKTEIGDIGTQEFDFELRMKDFEPIALVLVPDLEIPDDVFVTGKFSSSNHSAQVNGFIPVIAYKKIKANNVIFDQATTEDALNLFITSDRIDITNDLFIQNVNLANVLQKDSLNFNIKLSDVNSSNQLDLNGLIEFDENAATRLSLLPSSVIINNQDWRVQEKVRFGFEEGKTRINGLELSQGSQRVTLNGVISKDEEDALDIQFEDFLLSTFNPLSQSFGIDFKGTMNGKVAIKAPLRNPYIQADLSAKNIFYNETAIGNMDVVAGLDQYTKLVNLDLVVKDNHKETMHMMGTYDAKRKYNNIDLNIQMSEGELILFQPFLQKLVSDLHGTATVDLAVSGTALSPVINGSANLNNAAFTVNYLQTPYSINETVNIEDSKIILDNLHILDGNKNEAIANGTVDMSKPITPDIQVDIAAKNFLVLNTSAKDNPMYYGIAYGTGTFSFHGPTDNMNIAINASTDEGTVFNLPLNAAGTVTDRDFISFVPKDSSVIVPKSKYFQGLTLSLDLDVSREAEANIYTDLGRLSGRGEGLLSMNISSQGDFEMFGDYVISEGEFVFTAQDFINKEFDINRGGSIRWTGNPTEALINLTATYDVRTSVRPLYIAAGRAGTDQRVMAQAEMILNGNLLHPDISFGVNFPTDSYVKDELQSYFTDANNVNQQALSLIVRRSFAPGTGTDLTRELNTTVLSAGTELAFNQLNNIISQSLNLNFVDFNIRSLNEASASIRLLSNRLILTGGVTDRRGELNDFNVFGKEVASDVEALYLIRKSGNLLLRASNRLNNRNFLNPNDEYVSALGLVYRQEFDTFGEFFRKIMSFRKEKELTETAKPDSSHVGSSIKK